MPSVSNEEFLVQLVLAFRNSEENEWKQWPTVSDVWEMYGHGAAEVLDEAVDLGIVERFTTKRGIVRVRATESSMTKNEQLVAALEDFADALVKLRTATQGSLDSLQEVFNVGEGDEYTVDNFPIVSGVAQQLHDNLVKIEQTSLLWEQSMRFSAMQVEKTQ